MTETAKKAPKAPKEAKTAKAPKEAKVAKAAKTPKAAAKTSAEAGKNGVVKKTDTFTILQKRSGRYAVKGANGKWINAEEKVKILLAAGLIKTPAKKKAVAAEAQA
ncbi:MAG: hypothetical protein AABY86_01890 [Bdellovibrionota bacterium]